MIYTDGSSQPGQRSAADTSSYYDGWSFLVLAEFYGDSVTPGALAYGGHAHGQVQRDATHPQFAGADRVGSEVGEREALFWVGLWRISLNLDIATVFRCDSLTTMSQAEGACGASNIDQSFLLLRGVFQSLQMAFPSGRLLFAYAKAHQKSLWTLLLSQCGS